MERQAYIRPSAGSIWSVCAGYAALNAALGTHHNDESDNEVREDGVACHWLAQQLWEGHPVTPGSLSPNDRELTDEMFRAVDGYHSLLRSWPVSHVSLEQLIPVSSVFPGVTDGTPDAWAYDPTQWMLYVGDLKYGFRPVEVWRNLQLVIYAHTLMSMIPDAQRATLVILQPRCAHRDGETRTWVVTREELARLATDLAAAAMRCYAPVPDTTVNTGCRNCAAAYGCRTLQAAGGAGVDVSYDATPMELNEQQLGYELSKLLKAQEHIKNRITGLSVQAESLMRRGKRIPGFEMGRGGTRWRWRAGSEAVVRRLGELFGVAVLEEPKLKTVAKLRGVLPDGIAHMYAEKPDGELKLRLTDPNEAEKRMGP